MRRLLCALALIACAVLPARADLVTLLGASAPDAPTYVMPAQNAFAEVLGHSVVGDSGGMDNNRTAYTSLTHSVSYQGWPGWLFPLTGAAFVPEASYNYGVGGSTTARTVGGLTSTGNDCDDNAVSTSSPCAQTLVLAKPSSSVSAGTTSSFTVVAPTFGAFVNGASYYINTLSSGMINQNCEVVVAGTSAPYTVTLPGTQACAVLSTLSTSTSIGFVPPANTSSFASYAPSVSTAVANGVVYVDALNSLSSFGGYSPATDPAKIVFVHAGANDGNYPCTETTTPPGNSCQTLTNMAAVLDAFRPANANKVVILANERPYGAAASWSNSAAASNGDPEIHCVGESSVGSCASLSGYNATLHNTPKDVQHVFYAPCGTGSSGTYAVSTPCGTGGTPSGVFTPGANDGVELTQVGSAPAQGQYSISGSVLTFNSADQGARIAVFYRWLTGATGDHLVRFRDWANSASCTGSFQDELGYWWAINGAKCNRPWVRVADTWGAYCDPAACSIGGAITAASQLLPKPGATYSDGNHPNAYGNHLHAGALAAAASVMGAVAGSPAFAWPTGDPNPGSFPSTVSLATSTSNGSGTCASGSASGPTTTTVGATSGTSMNIASTAGMSGGGVMTLYIGGVSQSVTISSVNSTTNITLSGSVTVAGGTTVNFVGVTAKIQNMVTSIPSGLTPYLTLGAPLIFNTISSSFNLCCGTAYAVCIDTTNNKVLMGYAYPTGGYAVNSNDNGSSNMMEAIDPTVVSPNQVFFETATNGQGGTNTGAITGCGGSNANCGTPTGGISTTANLACSSGGPDCSGQAIIQVASAQGAQVGMYAYLAGATSPAGHILSVSGSQVTLSANLAGNLASGGAVVFSSASNQEVIAKGYPNGWSAPNIDSSSQTAITNGSLGLAFGLEQNPFGDGNDDFVIQLSGFWGASGGTISLTDSAPIGFTGLMSVNDRHRTGCKFRIGAGPNGRLYGVDTLEAYLTDAFAATSIASDTMSGHSNYAAWSALAGAGAYAITDLDIASGMAGVSNGSLLLPTVSAPAQYLSALTAANSPVQPKIVIGGTAAGDPVSATIRVSQCWARKVTQ